MFGKWLVLSGLGTSNFDDTSKLTVLLLILKCLQNCIINIIIVIQWLNMTTLLQWQHSFSSPKALNLSYVAYYLEIPESNII